MLLCSYNKNLAAKASRKDHIFEFSTLHLIILKYDDLIQDEDLLIRGLSSLPWKSGHLSSRRRPRCFDSLVDR